MPALLLAACSSDPYVIDPFPVSVSFEKGVPKLIGCAPELAACEGAPLTVVIDTGTPITVVDAPATPRDQAISRVHTSLDLQAVGPAPANLPVTRARFLGFTAFWQPLGKLGLDTDLDPLVPQVVLGGDRLASLATRLDPNSGQLFFFPNIAGADEVLGRECAAVVPTQRLGGGSFTLEGAQIGLPATRLVVGTCLNLPANPDRSTPPPRRPPLGGANALLVVATGLPMTVLSRAAWDRACHEGELQNVPDACKLSENQVPLHLPGMYPDESTLVRLGTLNWVGFAADEVKGDRGPCQEIRASRIMDLGGCSSEIAAGTCPCADGIFCRAGASGEIAGPIQVAVLEDKDPILQGLRDELRPGVADVDGFLGMNVLMPFVTDFDYPHSRLIFRCEGAQQAKCVVRPRLPDANTRQGLLPCLGQQFFDPT